MKIYDCAFKAVNHRNCSIG